MTSPWMQQSRAVGLMVKKTSHWLQRGPGTLLLSPAHPHSPGSLRHILMPGRRIFLEIDLIPFLHSLNTSVAPYCPLVQTPPSAGASVYLCHLPLLSSSPHWVCKSLTPAYTSPPVLCSLLGTHSTSST